MLNYFKKLDWYIIIFSLILGGIGALQIYSISLGEENFLNFKKQVFFLIAGFLIMFFLSFFDLLFER